MSNTTTTTEAAGATNPAFQQFGNRTVRTVKGNRTGIRAAEITTRGHRVFIPMDICGLAAGEDAWMRDILFKCGNCGERVKAGDMEGGCGLCPDCYDKAGEENARLDSADEEAANR